MITAATGTDVCFVHVLDDTERSQVAWVDDDEHVERRADVPRVTFSRPEPAGQGSEP